MSSTVGGEVELDAPPLAGCATVSVGAETVGGTAVGAATVNDVGAARATLVGASRTVAVGVAGDPVVNTGRGAMPGAVFDDAGAAGLADRAFAFEAVALWAAFGQRFASRAERALPRRLAHAASRRALEVDFARAWPPAGAL